LLLDDRERLNIEQRTAETASNRFSESLSEQKQAVNDLEREIHILGEVLYTKKNLLTEAKTSLEESQSRIGFLEKRINELGLERQESDERVRGLEIALDEKRRAYEDLCERRNKLEVEANRIEEEEARIVDLEARAEERCREARGTLARIESESLNLTGKELSLKNKTVEIQAHFQSAHKGFQRIAERQNLLARNIAEVCRELNQYEKEIVLREGENERLNQALGRGKEQAHRGEDEINRLDGRIKSVESELIKRESRIEALENLISTREGVSSGAKAVLAEACKTGSQLSFVKGLLGELVEVDVAHSAAMEAALGDAAQAVVVETIEQARQVMVFLDQKARGRVTLLPLAEFGNDQLKKPDASSSLFQHVRCPDPELKKAVDLLLVDVRLIEKFQLTEKGIVGQLRKAVTSDGDEVDRFGVLSVGSVTPDAGVISRRSELAALEKERGKLREEREDLLRQRAELAARNETIAKANQELMNRIECTGRTLADTKTLREKHLERYRYFRKEYTLNAQDAYELEKNFHTLRATLSELDEEMGHLGDTLAALHETLKEARNTLDGRSAEKERHARLRREFELQIIQFRERKDGIDNESGLMAKSLEEVQEQLTRLATQKDRLEDSKNEMQQGLEEMKSKTAGLLEKRSAYSMEISEVEERLEKLKEALQQDQKAYEATNASLEEVRCKLDELRVEERGNQVRCEGLLEKVREELRIDLEEGAERVEGEPDGIDSSGHEIDSPEQEGESQDREKDWDAVAQEIDEIKERLSRMGSVNLDAINELQEVEERFEGLTRQREDLLKSIKGLEELIQTLNQESREKFIDTFERVRSHFNDIFRKLFQGGKADVRLEEGEDVLEAGVEIIAGPPGKDVRSISLLSGGERTLTAVGLLFALFKSRPSPFCILDEVDAALDEVNIERFCNCLDEFVRGSQFLIVTHSKRTMSFSDYLYGITMQEDGVTSHISLNLETYEEPAA
ncbi:MAG: AAA family ATPase, partial [Planctomycetes bacterium]|nr:AAA family ATPase [Planctomycetota bacterium]